MTAADTCRKVHGRGAWYAGVAVLLLFAPGERASAARPAYSLQFERTALVERGETGKSLPVAVTLDPRTGELCVTDARQGNFHLLGAGDIEVFRSGQLAGVASPWDGSIDPAGRVVYAERGLSPQGSLRRLNVFGEPDVFAPELPDSLWSPLHVIVTRDGNYVSLDPTSGVLTKHDAESGALLWQRRCEVPGASGETIGRPAEAPDGRLYVPGGDLRAILVFAADGTPVATFGEFGSAPGHVVLPVGAAFGPAGEVLVLDRIRHKLLVFDQNHEFLAEFGSMGFRPGQFYHPAALAAAPDGRIYVAQGFQGRIQVYQLAQRGDGDPLSGAQN